MKLPTHQQCLELFDTYKVPLNIKEHCLKVNKIAVFLAKKLQESGVKINLDVVDRGSLLHDLFKIAAIENPYPNKFHKRAFTPEELAMRERLRQKYPGKFENEIAYEELKEPYPKLALVLKKEGDPYNRTRNWEESIIHYVDMRTLRDDIVSLDARFAYFEEKYKRDDPFWSDYLPYCRQEEKKIFQHLSFKPEDLDKACGEA
ncbi:hypothetical protein J4421_02895 [Candidatus Woesearchaeota archaeon]|nr:hypothetical protein [Candidatus Woesearchaeota archaeon]